MIKVAFINQRYGLEVNGGSEYFTRKMAEHLKSYCEIDVLTTKAKSYEKWENFYKEDEEFINGVKVKRFNVSIKRCKLLQKVIGKILKLYKVKWKWLNKLWIIFQGPYSPDLINYIKNNTNNYDIFIFVTYLYYSSAVGLPIVAKKSIFVPTAHDEYMIDFSIYKQLFISSKAIVYLTEEEQNFVHKKFRNKHITNMVSGMGIEINNNADGDTFCEKFGVKSDYLIYVGRVDESKGCQEMFDYFVKYLSIEKPNLLLVVIGQKFMCIPENPNIKYLGYVSEEDKMNGIKGAKALWLPSMFESLSISVLEAMGSGRPVIVNGVCEVLKGHCLKSNGGVYYETYEEFVDCINYINGNNYKELCLNARCYIEKNYSWNEICNNWVQLIEELTRKRECK